MQIGDRIYACTQLVRIECVVEPKNHLKTKLLSLREKRELKSFAHFLIGSVGSSRLDCAQRNSWALYQSSLSVSA